MPEQLIWFLDGNVIGWGRGPQGRPGIVAGDDQVNQKSTDQLLKLMITSGVLSEADGVLSEADDPDFSMGNWIS